MARDGRIDARGVRGWRNPMPADGSDAEGGVMMKRTLLSVGICLVSVGGAMAAVRPASASGGATEQPSAPAVRPDAGQVGRGKGARPKMFVLRDGQRTGAWVVAMPVPDGYVGDGKAFWVSEPSCPFHWYLSLTSRDGRYKAFLNDSRYFFKNCYGNLANAPEFSTADGFADFLMQSVGSTYGLSKMQVYHASYNPCRPKETPATRQTRETCREYHWYDFKAIYTGERPNGQVAAVIFLAEIELNIPHAVGNFCFVTMNCARSCCYPPGAAKRALTLMKYMLGTATPNLEFSQYVARVSRDATSRWVQSSNEQQRQFNEVMSNQQASYDRWSSEWDRVIRETETLTAGNGDGIEVPWGADHSYVDGDGHVIQKDDEDFMEKARQTGRTADAEREAYEREHKALRKLVPQSGVSR